MATGSTGTGTTAPETAPRGALLARTALPAAVWAATRALLLLMVLGAVTLRGPDVTSDVEVIYRGWYEVLRTGTYPLADVTWQYPPGAALAILSPALLPGLDYPAAFFVLVLLCDLLVLALLRYAERRGRSRRGTWMWVAGVPLLGPTVYARYDLMVTAVAVAALLALARRPRLAGALAAFGALLKVWPALVLLGTGRGRSTRRAWTAAGVTAVGLTAVLTAAMPGALAFLTFQRDRGTEIESVGALVFHLARHAGWEGQVLMNYGSVEFIGPYVGLVSALALALAAAAGLWLLAWRLRARTWGPGTPADAAFTAVLLFTVTSRVISPQYLVWLVGLAAVCLVRPGTRMARPALLVAAATAVTGLEFPVWFDHVVASDPLGITLLVVRNGLLAAAALLACRALWRATVPAPASSSGDASAPVGGVSPDARADSPATPR
ncbi:glycosyltransferase 87 family protein [Streptomyces sp. NPDC005805]|uniref:glycosyltransferase 87 family protein n=1 Tax=Streptomyces sp. NPDC005805 TaxID=3157068 RepID=UPI00340BED61